MQYYKATRPDGTMSRAAGVIDHRRQRRKDAKLAAVHSVAS